MTDDTSPVKPISRRLRYEILRRDNHTCRYCGGTAPDVKLTVDHVMPRALGGSDEPTNLVTACVDCNAGKSSTNPDAEAVDGVTRSQLVWAAAARRVAEDRRAQTRATNRVVYGFESAWTDWHFNGNPDDTAPLDHDWEQSIRTFMAAGLDLEDLRESVRVAMKSKAIKHAKWKYFCGVCWNEIKARQELTRTVVEPTPPDSDDPWFMDFDAPKRTYYNPGCAVCEGTGVFVDAEEDIRYECWCASDFEYPDHSSR